MKTIFSILALAALAAVPAFGQTPPTPVQSPTQGQTPAPILTPVSLKYRVAEGTVFNYKMNATFDVQTGSVMEAHVVVKLLKIDPDGTYSLQNDTVNGTVTTGGAPIPMQKSSSVTVYKSTGEVVSVSSDQTDKSAMRAENLMILKRPDNPVKPGDTWTLSIKADPVAKTPSVQGTYTFDGESTVGAFHVYIVRATVSEGDVSTPGSVLSTYYINKDDGSLVKAETKYTDMVYAGAPSPLSGTLTMVRESS